MNLLFNHCDHDHLVVLMVMVLCHQLLIADVLNDSLPISPCPSTCYMFLCFRTSFIRSGIYSYDFFDLVGVMSHFFVSFLNFLEYKYSPDYPVHHSEAEVINNGDVSTS